MMKMLGKEWANIFPCNFLVSCVCKLDLVPTTGFCLLPVCFHSE